MRYNACYALGDIEIKKREGENFLEYPQNKYFTAMEAKNKEYLEIEIRRNIKSKRIVLSDRQTGVSFASFDKKSFVAEFFETHHSEKITEFKPNKI